jgi:hypothetical protein
MTDGNCCDKRNQVEELVAIPLLSERVLGAIRNAAEALGERRCCNPASRLTPMIQMQLAEYEQLATLAPRVMAGDLMATVMFRERFDVVTGRFASIEPRKIPNLAGPIVRDPCEFVGFGTIGGIYLAARILLAGEEKPPTTRARLEGVRIESEWVESLFVTATHFARTGDLRPFRHRAGLYLRQLEQTYPVPGESGGPPVPGSPIREFPPWDECSIRREICVNEVVDQLERFRSESDRPEGPPVFNDNITSVTESACAGEELIIRGRDFGDSQPSHISLLLPSDEGCSAAEVPVGQWTDTEIRLPTPSWARRGPIGFRDENLVRDWERYRNRLESASEDINSASADCRRIGGNTFFTRPGGLRNPQCPGETPYNLFAGTIPEVLYFTADGETEITVEPEERFTLGWDVINADRVTLRRVSGPGPAPSSGPRRLAGAETLSIDARDESLTIYRLEAENRCDRAEAEVHVHLACELELELIVSGLDREIVLTPGSSDVSRDLPRNAAVTLVATARSACGIRNVVIEGDISAHCQSDGDIGALAIGYYRSDNPDATASETRRSTSMTVQMQRVRNSCPDGYPSRGINGGLRARAEDGNGDIVESASFVFSAAG